MKAFYSNLTCPLWKQEVMGAREFTRFQFWPLWSAASISKSQQGWELSLLFTTLQYLSPSTPTTHSLLCIFTRVLGICNCFQKFSLRKVQEFPKCFSATWRIQAEGERKTSLIFPETDIFVDSKNIKEQIFIKPWKA